MKKLFAILASIAIAGSVYAGCGKKITSVGKLEAFDVKKKTLTLEKGTAKDKKGLKLTSKTKITGSDGKAAKIDSLKGKSITVISEHGKVNSVSITKKKKG